jgi:GTP cyclohydrolase FolE2
MQCSKLQRKRVRLVITIVDTAHDDEKRVFPSYQISAPHFPICPTQNHITVQAYENPFLIEEVVSNAATLLQADQKVHWFEFRALNKEGIHNRSAFSESTYSKFDGRILE